MSNAAVSSTNSLVAAFENGFTGMVPAEAPTRSLTEQLAPFLNHIVAKKKGGFSWEQIAQVLGQPEIGIKIAPNTLRRLCTGKRRAAKPQSKPITSVRVLPPPNDRIAAQAPKL